VSITTLAAAAGLFAVTNIDDLLILALYFARTAGRREAAQVVAGQYLGFLGILVIAALGAAGAALLPDRAVPYLGLVPLALGLRAGWAAWRHDRDDEADPDGAAAATPSALAVAAVTFANGGDNIGVYVPVLATSSAGERFAYVSTFLALVAVWCAAGFRFARQPLVARALARWGHVLLPIVLIGIGVVILLGAADARSSGA
jgi:cadmium resistance protein CadD (predicted permease)